MTNKNISPRGLLRHLIHGHFAALLTLAVIALGTPTQAQAPTRVDPIDCTSVDTTKEAVADEFVSQDWVLYIGAQAQAFMVKGLGPFVGDPPGDPPTEVLIGHLIPNGILSEDEYAVILFTGGCLSYHLTVTLSWEELNSLLLVSGLVNRLAPPVPGARI